MIILGIVALIITFYVFWTLVAGIFVVRVGKEINRAVKENKKNTQL